MIYGRIIAAVLLAYLAIVPGYGSDAWAAASAVGVWIIVEMVVFFKREKGHTWNKSSH